MLDIHFGDNLPVLRQLPDESVDLIYVDPPFNTGRTRSHTRLATVADPQGDRNGFQGKRYRSVKLGTRAFQDRWDDFLVFRSFVA